MDKSAAQLQAGPDGSAGAGSAEALLPADWEGAAPPVRHDVWLVGGPIAGLSPSM